MNATPFALRTARWMVRDTFRQSLASKLFWVMLGLTVLCTAFALSVNVSGTEERERHPHELPFRMPKGQGGDGVDEAKGRVSVGFGMVTYAVTKNRADSVRELQVWLAGVLADTAGVLLALLWTAGFLPSFLEPHAVTVLLAKPAPRWTILAGKYVGVVLFVALHATLFVGGTWLGLGAATGVWDVRYWLAVPLLVTNFAVFYAISALLAVCTRSTVVAVFGTLLFWVLCWAMNYTHLRLNAVPVEGVTSNASFLVELGYWVLPKPLDLSGLFFDAMNAGAYTAPVPEIEAAKARGMYHPELSALASLAFAAGALLVAAYEFRTQDY
ncbi:MAG: transcriptional regulator [Planctomycetes bacterium]|nr:transcriptional regulator [Planctomycetota bacterium]